MDRIPCGRIGYTRETRAVGDSKFSVLKLLGLAIEGFTSFSTVPLRIASICGLIGTLFTLIYAFWVLIKTLTLGPDVPGYPSLFIVICFFGSMQLLVTGIAGEYLGRVYMESKQRPIYIIRRHIRNNKATTTRSAQHTKEQ